MEFIHLTETRVCLPRDNPGLILLLLHRVFWYDLNRRKIILIIGVGFLLVCLFLVDVILSSSSSGKYTNKYASTVGIMWSDYHQLKMDSY